ncbi:MAG: nucleoside monophosphate kinase [Candidatus Uhrbacteria bacterium]
MYRIAMLGPQGSGKGTQSELLSQALEIPQITPGVMYRLEVESETVRGKEIAPILDRGGMVPDDITNEMIRTRLSEPDCANGYILDGYPRTLEQVADIDAHLEPLTHVIFIDITDASAVARLSDRWVCSCGKPYRGSELKRLPGEEARCTVCGGVLHRRPDDEPDAIRRRLETYHEYSEKVIDEFRRRGSLIEVHGEQPIADVFAEIRTSLGLLDAP